MSLIITIKKPLLLALCCTALLFLACGLKHSAPNSEKAPEEGSSITANPTHPRRRGPATGMRLFKITKDPAALAAAKATFLTTDPVIKSNRHGLNRYALNNRYVAYRAQAFSPAIFGYWASTTEVRFTAKLSDDFRNNIPQKIKDIIGEYEVDSLDLFFTPQAYDKGAGFKPHAWAANPQAIPFAGFIYNRDLDVAIFDADRNIDQDIQTGIMTTWNFSIHDNTLSPKNPELNIPASGLPISFWSLVIDPIDKKAAVTLHWILEVDDRVKINEAIEADFPNGSMDKLIKRLDANVSFKDTPMMKKLKDFIC